MRVAVAAETPGGWDPAPGASRLAAVPDPRPADVVELSTAVDAAVATDVDSLTDPQLRTHLEVVTSAQRRLEAHRAKLTAALTTRERERARQANPRDPRAGEKAAKRLRRELVDDLNLTPSEVKRDQEVGGRLLFAPEARAAFENGRLTPAQAAIVTDALRHVEDRELAQQIETKLVDAAPRCNTVELGRLARRLLAEQDPEAADEAQARRHQRRTGRVWQDEHGFVHVNATVSGMDGEFLLTAVHAFRRPDAPDEQRSSEQTTADAVVAMARAALETGTAPADRRVRPHVNITVSEQDLARGHGVAQTLWSDALPLSEAEPLLEDVTVSRLVRDARGLPVEASVAVRTVPIGLYRCLIDRDGGCIAEGCDMPVRWCDVIHLGEAYRFGGTLDLGNAALACRYHHTKFDRGDWQLQWRAGRPVLKPPGPPPDEPDG